MVLDIATTSPEGFGHSLGEIGPEIAVIMRVYPQHGNARRSSKLSRRLNQVIGRAIVVLSAIEMPAATGGKTDDGTYRSRVLAGKRDSSPSAARLSDDDGFIALDECLGRHVFDDPPVDGRNGKPGITERGVGTFAHYREEDAEQTPLGDLNGRDPVSRTYRCDYRETMLCEPKGGGAELDLRKVAALHRIERDSVVHDQKRKWPI